MQSKAEYKFQLLADIVTEMAKMQREILKRLPCPRSIEFDDCNMVDCKQRGLCILKEEYADKFGSIMVLLKDVRNNE